MLLGDAATLLEDAVERSEMPLEDAVERSEMPPRFDAAQMWT